MMDCKKLSIVKLCLIPMMVLAFSVETGHAAHFRAKIPMPEEAVKRGEDFSKAQDLSSIPPLPWASAQKQRVFDGVRNALQMASGPSTAIASDHIPEPGTASTLSVEWTPSLDAPETIAAINRKSMPTLETSSLSEFLQEDTPEGMPAVEGAEEPGNSLQVLEDGDISVQSPEADHGKEHALNDHSNGITDLSLSDLAEEPSAPWPPTMETEELENAHPVKAIEETQPDHQAITDLTGEPEGVSAIDAPSDHDEAIKHTSQLQEITGTESLTPGHDSLDSATTFQESTEEGAVKVPELDQEWAETVTPYPGTMRENAAADEPLQDSTPHQPDYQPDHHHEPVMPAPEEIPEGDGGTGEGVVETGVDEVQNVQVDDHMEEVEGKSLEEILTLEKDSTEKTSGDASPQRDAAPSQRTSPVKQRVLKSLMGETFAYEPQGMADPFVSFITQPEPAPLQFAEDEDSLPQPPVQRRPLTPLQRMSLGEIEQGLRAILWGDLGRRAVIEDNTGKGFIVTEGTPASDRNGVITEIFNDSIVIQQEIWDSRNRRIQLVNSVIRLKKQ